MSCPIILDCDPGIDDAIALLLAFASPAELELQAITTVAGNVGLDLTTANACRVRELAGRVDVPIHAGCARPLLVPPVSAPRVHGATGLDGAGLPPPASRPTDTHAVDAIIALAEADPGAVTLVAVGPLTNLALAMRKHPPLAGRLRRIVLMGGAAGAGNITPVAEFNFGADPHAAHIVFDSGAPIVMAGLDVTHQARADLAWIDRIAGLNSPVGDAVAGMMARYRTSGGGAMHDALAVGYLLRPDLFTGEPCRVSIVTDRGAEIGRSIVERGLEEGGAAANATVLFGIDRPGFLDFLAQRLARL